jgi:salicylate hydroxylase
MRGVSVAVAGCGPCGLATALLLSRQGHRVTLFERFVEPRPIGSGLMIQPTGQAVLAELGLLARVLAEGSRIDRLFGCAGDRIVLDVRYRSLGRASQFGIGVHRSGLF